MERVKVILRRAVIDGRSVSLETTDCKFFYLVVEGTIDSIYFDRNLAENGFNRLVSWLSGNFKF